VKQPDGDLPELPGAGAQHESDLASWPCESGKCNPETKECENGKRLSRILQFKEAQESACSPNLRSPQSLIGITMALIFSTLFL